MPLLQKVLSAGSLLVIVTTGISAGVQLKHKRELEERATIAARILQNTYVLTPSQKVRIVYANAWQGNVCVEYVVDG